MLLSFALDTPWPDAQSLSVHYSDFAVLFGSLTTLYSIMENNDCGADCSLIRKELIRCQVEVESYRYVRY